MASERPDPKPSYGAETDAPLAKQGTHLELKLPGLGVTIRVVMVTPAMARELLKSNEHNRNLRPALVESYARMMERGEWLPAAGEPLYFQDGRLTNGQHRLSGQVKAGATLVYVVRLASDAAQAVADTGAGRRFGDLLRMRGEGNYHQLAAAVRAVMVHERTGTLMAAGGSQMLGLSNPLMLARWEQERERFIEAVRRAAHLRRSGVPVAPSVGAFLYYSFSRVSKLDANAFFDQLASGEDLGQQEPIFVLRQTLLRAEANRRRGENPPQVWQAAIGIKAFNAYRLDRPIKTLAWRGGAAGERFPEVAVMPWDKEGEQPPEQEGS